MQNKLFTSPLYRFLNRIADLFCVSLLTLIFSIPLITIFAAITAAHNVTQDMVFDTESAIFNKYWNAFRANIKQATFSGFILSAALAIALVNLVWFPGLLPDSFSIAVRILFVILLIALLGIANCIFPLIARYHNSIIQHFKNAVIIILIRPIRVFLILFINILPLLILLFNPAFLIYTLAFWTFFGFGLLSYLTNLLLRPVLIQLESKT